MTKTLEEANHIDVAGDRMAEILKIAESVREIMAERDRETARADAAEARVRELEAVVRGLLAEWDMLTRYGSPIAKAANERVQFARAALAGRAQE